MKQRSPPHLHPLPNRERKNTPSPLRGEGQVEGKRGVQGSISPEYPIDKIE